MHSIHELRLCMYITRHQVQQLLKSTTIYSKCSHVLIGNAISIFFFLTEDGLRLIRNVSE